MVYLFVESQPKTATLQSAKKRLKEAEEEAQSNSSKKARMTHHGNHSEVCVPLIVVD